MFPFILLSQSTFLIASAAVTMKHRLRIQTKIQNQF
jgi:hypothetical protein